jgi:hypothetical protein
MAKKVRRTRRTTTRREGDLSSRSAGTGTSSPSLTAQEEFEAEYSYVLKDLRWVFILAAIMFTLLIVLNLVLG